LQYALVLALVFLTINLIRPETHEKTLMPALQSPWFVPHVVVYIFAYALLAVSSLVAIKGLYQMWLCTYQPSVLAMADTLTRYGFAFLTLGLVFGALWAKEAWGDYWTWDPKETWALLTWMTYLVYIHLRYHRPHMHKAALVILALSFVVLLVCWFGLNYLPTAQNSVHTYTQ
jgi:ABC-type transport system involved in cytochrome c biogenesis permease subunit